MTTEHHERAEREALAAAGRAKEAAGGADADEPDARPL